MQRTDETDLMPRTDETDQRVRIVHVDDERGVDDPD